MVQIKQLCLKVFLTTLGHVIVVSRRTLLELRYNWRLNSILLNVFNTIESQEGLEILADIECYLNPSIITNENQLPDFVVTECNMMLLLEVTIRFKTSIAKSFNCKQNVIYSYW